MALLRHLLTLALGIGVQLSVQAKDAPPDPRFREAVRQYEQDEERLASAIHYQQVSGGTAGESIRREAWVALDGVLIKTIEERRGPKGSELTETSLNEMAYFLFHQTTKLLGDGSTRVDEERKYWSDGEVVRWSKRSASFPAGTAIEMKPVKQQVLPLTNLAPDDQRTDRPTDAATAIYEALRKAGTPDRDPTADAGPDWKRVKLVKGTSSPNGRYQLAWAPKEFKGDWEAYHDDELKDYVAFDDAVRNFIFDLKAMRIAGETRGVHFGMRQHYNHREVSLQWSPDSTNFVELTTDKWNYTSCCAGKIVDGKLLGCVDLGAPAERAAATFLVAKKDRAWRKHGNSLSINLGDAEIANDGTLALTLYGEVPKSMEDDSSFIVRVRLRLMPTANGVGVTSLGAAYAKE